MGCSETEVVLELPLLSPTPIGWARLAADQIEAFLADHAVCEQQAALSALNLVAHYPEDDELVRRMSALAAEEVQHLRRVTALLHRRGGHLMRRRPNPYTRGLHDHVAKGREPRLKIDRLLVGALIEARSCERFTRLHAEIQDRDPEVAALLAEVGPAERRHWRMFHELAARDTDPGWFTPHWMHWLAFERDLASSLGHRPTVHG